MQELESAESTQKRGPFFNLSSLPTSSSFSTPTSSMELFSSLGGEEGGREGWREGGEGCCGDHQKPEVAVPKEISTLQQAYEGR